jgi:hypothetical protein
MRSLLFVESCDADNEEVFSVSNLKDSMKLWSPKLVYISALQINGNALYDCCVIN